MKFLRHFLEERQPGSPVTEEPKKPRSSSAELERVVSKDNETEKRLATREVVDRRNLGGGINVSEIIELKDDGKAVFKPKEGEHEFYDYKVGSLYKRERAAYLVSRFLDLGLVPPTVIKEVDGRIGSAQEFVPGTMPFLLPQKEFKKFLRNHNEELIKLWLFDYIIWNADRHGNNLLIKDNKVIAIDNGLSFGGSRHCPQKYLESNVLSEKIPSEVVSRFQTFLADTELKQTLSDLLFEHLTKEEAEACLARIERIGEVIIKKKSQISAIFDDKYKLKFNPFK